MSVKGSRGQVEIERKDIRSLEENPGEVIGKVEEFRRNILQKFRDQVREVESGLENSCSFRSVRLFSEYAPGDKRKPMQLIAASLVYQDRRDSRGVTDRFYRENSGSDDERLDKIAEYAREIEEKDEKFFLSGDASYYPSEDVLVLQHMTRDLVDMQPRIEELPRLFDPLLGYMFSGEVGLEDLKDTVAHELTHSWLQKNSMKPEVEPSERMEAVEESFAYLAGWTQSGRKPKMQGLKDSETPLKGKVVWATKVLVQKAKKEDRGIDWVRKTAQKIYEDFSEGKDPFVLLLRKAMPEKDAEKIRRFRQVIKHHLKPVFHETEDVLERLGEEEMHMSEKIALRRIEQIHENFDWSNPEEAERRVLRNVFIEAEKEKQDLDGLDTAITVAMDEEAEIVVEYTKKLVRLEEKIPETDSLNELETAAEHLRKVGEELEQLA